MNKEVISEQDKLRYVRHILQRHYKETEIFLGDIKLKVIYNRYLEIEYIKGIKKKGLKKELLVEQLGVKQSVLFESKVFFNAIRAYIDFSRPLNIFIHLDTPKQ